jgi:hypothetical protein
MPTSKAKKLMDELQQEREDYKEEGKVIIEKLNKTIEKASMIGTKMNLYNARRKRASEALTSLKEKNAPLKKFDELEGMINNYEQILFNNHLFTDAEESHLTKLDLYYAN